MNKKFICFVFGGYDKIRGTYYYCKEQEKTGYLTTDVKKATLLSDSDIDNFYTKLNKDIVNVLKTLSCKIDNDEETEYYVCAIVSKSITICRSLTIPKLVIDTLQRKLVDTEAESNVDYNDSWINNAHIELLDILKANNYFSQVMDITNINACKPTVLSMIKTSYV